MQDMHRVAGRFLVMAATEERKTNSLARDPFATEEG